MADRPHLLLLTPSRNLGGGLERVSDAFEAAWPGEVTRLDLIDGARDDRASASAKFRFAAGATVAATRRPDVVVTVLFGLLAVGHLAALIARARSVLLAAGLEVWAPMNVVQRHPVRSSHPLAISGFTAEMLARRSGIEPSRITRVTLPIAPTLIAAAARERPRPPRQEPLQLLTVSRLDPLNRYKGHFVIVEALAELQRRGVEVRWTVIGGGEDLGILREHCQAADLSEIVELRGSVSETDLHRAYAEADLLVLPSVADPDADPPSGEGFGLVYAEAAAFGVPSIAAREGGGALEFVNEETGVLVDGRAPESIADAIGRLAVDDELRQRLGDAARQRVLARHLPEHFGRQIEQLAEMARPRRRRQAR